MICILLSAANPSLLCLRTPARKHCTPVCGHFTVINLVSYEDVETLMGLW